MLSDECFALRVALRLLALDKLEQAGQTAVVCEAVAGRGEMWQECYRDVRDGIAFVEYLDAAREISQQRPTWSVLVGDPAIALRCGAGAAWTVNLLDVDGPLDPWPVVRAFLNTKRPRPKRLYVVVTDRLLPRIEQMEDSCKVIPSLTEAVQEFGFSLAGVYLEVCRWMLERTVGKRLADFSGYYAGTDRSEVHFLAEIKSR